jgi:hypothetical protein
MSRRRGGVRAHRVSQQRWRAVDAIRLVSVMRDGAKFVNGEILNEDEYAK